MKDMHNLYERKSYRIVSSWLKLPKKTKKTRENTASDITDQ